MNAWILAGQTTGSASSARRVEPGPSAHPGAGRVSVRMRAASLNLRDPLMIEGHYGQRKPDLIPLSAGALRVRWQTHPVLAQRARTDGVLPEHVCISQEQVAYRLKYLSTRERAYGVPR